MDELTEDAIRPIIADAMAGGDQARHRKPAELSATTTSSTPPPGRFTT
jgi:hypothetical protein